MRVLVLASLAFLCGVLTGVTGVILGTMLPARAAHLSESGLVQVTVGMPANEVPGKIGYPLEVQIIGSRSMAPLGQGTDRSWPGPYAWVYAKPGWLGHLEVNVTVANGVVSRVDVEYNDARVYSTHGPPSPLAPPLSNVLR